VRAAGGAPVAWRVAAPATGSGWAGVGVKQYTPAGRQGAAAACAVHTSTRVPLPRGTMRGGVGVRWGVVSQQAWGVRCAGLGWAWRALACSTHPGAAW